MTKLDKQRNKLTKNTQTDKAKPDTVGMATKMLGDMLPTSSPTSLSIAPTSYSEGLLQKIDIANRRWGKAKHAIRDVYNHALKDGWTPVEAARICREKLTFFSLRTIRGILPDESKNQNMKRPKIEIAESLPQIDVVETSAPESAQIRSNHCAGVGCDKETVGQYRNEWYCNYHLEKLNKATEATNKFLSKTIKAKEQETDNQRLEKKFKSSRPSSSVKQIQEDIPGIKMDRDGIDMFDYSVFEKYDLLSELPADSLLRIAVAAFAEIEKLNEKIKTLESKIDEAEAFIFHED